MWRLIPTNVLKMLLVEYLLTRNRHLTGEERSAKTREEVRESNGGIPLLIEFCLAMRSDPFGMIRIIGEVVNGVYGRGVTYAFPDPLVAAYRHSVVHVSLNSVLDGTELHCCRQGDLRARMSETVLFGKVKDPELIVLNFKGQLQDRIGGRKREGPIEVYPKFWNLNPVARDTREVLRIPAWTKSFEFAKRELATILDQEVLPTAIPEFPTVRRMMLGMNSPMVVPSLHARAAVERIAGTPCSSGIRQQYIFTPVKSK